MIALILHVTPPWVFVLFVYLLWAGMQRLHARSRTLHRL
jgi:hypothetical protein